jgi:UDP-GlcNAc:undecaprenyl-phosphate GlcNAc-1-phosphate transferase
LDRPGGYKGHAQPTPLLGGLAVVCGCLVGLAAAGGLERPRPFLALGVGAAVVLLAGLIDDRRALSASWKMGWQLLAATCAGACLLLLDVRLTLFVPAPIPMALLTLVWVVAVTNAMNLSDHANGLCAGLAALAAVALAGVNLRSGAHDVALASAVLAGACAGFLPFNWPRARIFLGDAGSMTIGFLLAGLAVLGLYTPGARVPALAVGVPLIALAVPLLDVAVVALLRWREGRPLWLGDRRHLAHRLERRGRTPARAVALAWAAAAASAATALVLPFLGPVAAAVALAALTALLVGLFAAGGSEGLS